jgi:predicted small secreted protein
MFKLSSMTSFFSRRKMLAGSTGVAGTLLALNTPVLTATASASSQATLTNEPSTGIVPTQELRSEVATHGSFLTIPIEGANDGIKHLLKMQLRTVASDRDGSSLTFSTNFLTDRLLLDFGAVQFDSIDLGKIKQDCDLIKEAIQEHPEVIREALNTITGNGKDISHILKAAESFKAIGLTEKQYQERSGGLLEVALLAAAAVLLDACTRVTAHGAAGQRPVENPGNLEPKPKPDAGPPDAPTD